jgi:hypothetical protein
MATPSPSSPPAISAKQLRIEPISAADANRLIRSLHYSHKVVNNSQLHFGVFLNGRCGGAMQFGPSLDKRKLQGLVTGTLWHEFIELNRLAFADWLPRNSESRALSIAFRLIRREYPHLKWCVSFADAAQCGDGTIYRASGFVLTGIRKNTSIWIGPSGDTIADIADITVKAAPKNKPLVFSRTSLTDGKSKQQQQQARSIVSSITKDGSTPGGGASMRSYIEAGFKPIPGFQLRYVYFLDPTARERLTVDIIPFSQIAVMGAQMYRGQARGGSDTSDTAGLQPAEDGATPIPPLP